MTKKRIRRAAMLLTEWATALRESHLNCGQWPTDELSMSVQREVGEMLELAAELCQLAKEA